MQPTATEPVLPGEPTGTPAGQRRLLVALAGALVLILLVIIGFAVLSGGGDEESSSTTTVAGLGRQVATTTSTTPPGPGSAETFEVFATKNPFLPLRGTGAGASGAGGAGTATSGGSATGGGTSTGGSGSGSGGSTAGGSGSGGTSSSGGGATGGGGANGGAEPRRGARVALMDVFAEGGRTMANVRVNDTVHKVGAGQVFATSFKVVSLSQADGCGRFLFGDDSFRLCKGEETLK